MKRNFVVAAGAILLGISLSACFGGGGKDSTTATVTPPAVTPKFETAFGGNFATAFQGSSTGEPKDVAPGDTIAVNPTAEPVALP
jgi:hypothetical protein